MKDTILAIGSMFLLAWLSVSTLQFALAIMDGVNDPETCHYNEGLRKIEYIFPAYHVGCWLAKR